MGAEGEKTRFGKRVGKNVAHLYGAAHFFVGVCSATESLRFCTAALLPRPPLHILKLPRAPEAVARTYILHGSQLMNWVIADLMPSLACSSRTAHCI